MSANLPTTVKNICVKAGPIVFKPDGTWCLDIVGDTADIPSIGGGGNGASGPHTHPTSDIIGLDTELANLTTGLAGKANLTHNHTQAEIDGLESNLTTIKASLVGKANLTHNHTQAEIDGLESNLTTIKASLADLGNKTAPANATTAGLVLPTGNITVTGTGGIDVNLGGYIPKPATATANQVLTYNGTNWLSANAAVNYILPIANATTLGGVKAGGNVTIDGTGLLSVNMPTGYTLPIANATALGGIKQGANTTIAADGAISVILPAAANLTGYLTQNTANTLYQPIGGGLQTLADAASIAWALDPSKIATVTLGGSRTLANPTNKAAGGTYLLIVKQDATGSRTLSYGTEYKFPSGIKPIMPTAPNSVTILTFVTDGVNMYGLSQGDFR